MKTPTNRSIVVCYHRILRGPIAPRDAFRFATDVGRFRQQMEVLARRWSIVPLHDLIGQLLRGSLRPRQAAVTFDDGYAGQYRHAFPVLQEMGIPATIFLITGSVNRDGSTRDGILDAPDGRPPRPRRYLNWQEVERMHQCGIAFGAHTHSHPSLLTTPDEVLREEILMSRDLIAAHLGVSPSVFAYPYGEADARAARAVEEAGFLGAVTTRDAPCASVSSRYLLPRVCVGNWERDVFARRLDEVYGGRMIYRVLLAYRSFRPDWARDAVSRRLDAACRRRKVLRVLRGAYGSLRWRWKTGTHTFPAEPRR